jgi:hypothetical protein
LSDLAILPAGSFKLNFQSAGLRKAESAFISILVGEPSQIYIFEQPGNSTGGIPLIIQPQVSVLDAGNNLVQSAPVNVKASVICLNFCSLLGNTLVATSSGFANFSDLAVDRIGEDYRINFTAYFLPAGNSQSVISKTFHIFIGKPRFLVIEQQPNSGIGGALLQPAPVICTRDLGGNLVTYSLDLFILVTLKHTAHPSLQGVLNGNTSSAIIDGCAKFSDLSISQFIGQVFLRFADSGGLLDAVNSTHFNVQVGLPKLLHILTQPESSHAGVAFPRQPILEIKDAGWNRIQDYNQELNVTLVVSNEPAIVDLYFVGDQLLRFWTPPKKGIHGTSAIPFSSGFANFTDLYIKHAGMDYILQFDSLGISVSSQPFDIYHGPVANLLLLSDFNTSFAGKPLAIQPTLGFVDAQGNLVSLKNATLRVQLGALSNHKATLKGTVKILVNSLKADFSDLAIDLIGTYTLNFSLQVTYTSGLFINQESPSFDVGYGDAERLVITAKNRTSGFFIAGAGEPTLSLEARVLDSGSNFLPAPKFNVTAQLWKQINDTRSFRCSGRSSCILEVNSSIPEDGELLTAFLSIDIACTDFDYSSEYISKLEVAGKDLLQTRDPKVSAGPWPNCFGSCSKTSRLLFDFNVTNSSTLKKFSIALSASSQVNVYPCDGNFLNAFVTLRLSYIIPLDSTTVLMAAPTLSSSGSQVTPVMLAIRIPGGPYALKFEAGVLRGTYLQWIEVVIGSAAQLVVFRQPGDGIGGLPLNEQPVLAILDAGNNLVQSDSGTEIVAFLFTTSNRSSVLLGNRTSHSLEGYASYSDLGVDKVGTGYRIIFATTLNGVAVTATSSSFNINFGLSSVLVVLDQPLLGFGGELLQPWIVCAADAGGNYNSSVWESMDNLNLRRKTSEPSNEYIEVRIGRNGAVRGKLSGTLQLPINDDGCSRFSDLTVNLAGRSYTLVFQANHLLKPVESIQFKIAVGQAFALRMKTSPLSMATAAQALPVQPVLNVVDQGGNIVSRPPYVVTAFLDPIGEWDPDSDPRLAGNRSVITIQGQAYFFDLRIVSQGMFSLRLTSPGLQNVSTNMIKVEPETSNTTILKASATINDVSSTNFGRVAQRAFLRAVADSVSISAGSASIISIEEGNTSIITNRIRVTFQVILASRTAVQSVMLSVTYTTLKSALFKQGLFLNLDSLVWTPEGGAADAWSGWWMSNFTFGEIMDVSVLYSAANDWVHMWAYGSNRSLSCAGPTLASRLRIVCYENDQPQFSADLSSKSEDEINGFLTQTLAINGSGAKYVRDMVLAQINSVDGVQDFLVVACAFNGSSTVTQSMVYAVHPSENNSVTLQVCDIYTAIKTQNNL